MHIPRLAPPLFALFLAACGRDRVAEGRGAAPTDDAALDSAYGATATENLRVVPVELEVRGLPAGWDGMRIAAVSDFNLGLWADNAAVAEAATQRAASSGAELIALLGGFYARGEDTTTLRRVLAPLRGHPAVAVLGPEGATEPGTTPDSAEIRLRATLAAAGVRVLTNQRTPLVRGGDTAYIGGVEPFFLQRPDWRQAEILSALASSVVLLSPLPNILTAPLPIAGRAFPLILAGHAGCGSVPPPGATPLARLRERVPGAQMPETERAFRVRGTTLLVTCGTGNSYIPVRLGAAPEVLLVTLRRATAAQPPSPPAPAPPIPDSTLRRYRVPPPPSDTAG